MAKLNVVIPELNVTVDGVEYRKVERKAQAGDIVRYDKDGYDYLPKGAFYRVYLDEDGDAVIDDEDGDPMWVGEDYTVFEPVSKPVAQQARLKVGDYVKVIEATVGYSKVGQIVKITMDDRTRAPFNTEGLDGTYTGWHYETGLVRATDEEVAAAKAALDPQFPIGDKVRLINGAGQRHLHGFTNGEICEVIVSGIDEDGDVKIKSSKGVRGYAKPDQLVKVTAEELAQEALTAKWAAIGRKVNEFKTGDIVEITETVRIAGVTAGDIEAVDGMRDGGVVLTKINPQGCNAWLYPRVVKLVTPVEQRFDRLG